jgi:hypothetical protein
MTRSVEDYGRAAADSRLVARTENDKERKALLQIATEWERLADQTANTTRCRSGLLLS